MRSLKMPNNCFFDIEAKGKPKDLKRFLKHFIYDNGVERKTYLARTFIDGYTNSKEYIIDKIGEIEKEEVFISGWCAWSCWSCWIEGYPNKKECITMGDLCKKYVIEINAKSEEGLMGFEEELAVSKDGYLTYEEIDFVEWKCKKCGVIQNFPKGHREDDSINEICGECGENKFERVEK